jgi:hypothetical protein
VRKAGKRNGGSRVYGTFVRHGFSGLNPGRITGFHYGGGRGF